MAFQHPSRITIEAPRNPSPPSPIQNLGRFQDMNDDGDVFENVLPLVYHPIHSPVSDDDCLPSVDEHVRLLDDP